MILTTSEVFFMSDSIIPSCSSGPYCVNLPYPASNKVQRQNTYYASILAEDYAGPGSEMTATNSYMYHHFITTTCNEDVSCILARIAICEMTHLTMLGKLICALGSSPKFQTYGDNKSISWSAENLNYECSIKDILTSSIKGEQAAIKQYKEHIKQINDPYVQAVIARILLDEELHLATLTYYHDKYGK